MVPADGAVVHHNVPGPQSHSVPLLHLKSFLFLNKISIIKPVKTQPGLDPPTITFPEAPAEGPAVGMSLSLSQSIIFPNINNLSETLKFWCNDSHNFLFIYKTKHNSQIAADNFENIAQFVVSLI